MSSKSSRVCSKYKDRDIHVNIYNALFNYYGEVDSFSTAGTKFYSLCVLETRKYLEKHNGQLNVSEKEMLYLIDKMANDSYKKSKRDDSLNELNYIHLHEVLLIANIFLKENPQNKISGAIQNLNKFELLFDSIRLNVDLHNISV